MSLKSRLTALVAAAPPDGTVPVRWIGELLAADGENDSEPESSIAIDMTVEEVAAKLGRGASTIRTWLARGELEGAYRNHGREWRIPLSAVTAMQRSESQRHASAPAKATSAETVELSSWRDHLPQRKQRAGK